MAFLRSSYDPLTERMRPVSPSHRQENATALYEFTERLVAERPEWQSRGECIGLDEADFFPGRGTPRPVVEATKAICEGCDVKAECLEMGMAEKFGIWGGKSEKERRKLRRLRALEES